MIGTALSFVRRELNLSFRKLQRDSSDVVVLTGLSGPTGTGAQEASNRLLLSLTNVRQETTVRNQQPPRWTPRPDGSRPPPPISIVLHVVFAANYSDYVTGLDTLTDAIALLQAKPVFDHDNSPDLDPRIERLAFSLLNLEYSELSYLWGLLGTDFRPSVFYEVRMLPLHPPVTHD